MPTPRVFYGWWLTLAFAVMVFISTGVRFTVGPFLKPITADLGLDRASFSLVVSAGLFFYGAFMPVVGWIADRVLFESTIERTRGASAASWPRFSASGRRGAG